MMIAPFPGNGKWELARFTARLQRGARRVTASLLNRYVLTRVYTSYAIYSPDMPVSSDLGGGMTGIGRFGGSSRKARCRRE